MEVGRELHVSVPPGYDWPGNVRELEQAVRSVLLNGRYAPQARAAAADGDETAVGLMRDLAAGTLDAGRAHPASWLLSSAVRPQRQLRRGRAPHRPRPPHGAQVCSSAGRTPPLTRNNGGCGCMLDFTLSKV